MRAPVATVADEEVARNLGNFLRYFQHFAKDIYRDGGISSPYTIVPIPVANSPSVEEWSELDVCASSEDPTD